MVEWWYWCYHFWCDFNQPQAAAAVPPQAAAASAAAAAPRHPLRNVTVLKKRLVPLNAPAKKTAVI